MDGWPTNGTQQTHVISTSDESDSPLTNEPRKRQEVTTGYPLYEGGITAANLQDQGGRLRWSFLSDELPGRRLLVARDSALVFPATRPKPHHAVRISVKQQAEEAANFIRVQYPDVEFASEVVKEHLTEDATRNSRLQEFDPYASGLLSPIAFQTGSRKPSAYMCFPMGETGCDLNISSLSYTSGKGVTFVASTKSFKTFETPIQHLSGSPPKADQQGSLLSVRTLSSTTLFQVEDPRGIIRLKELGNVSRSDLGDGHIIDTIPYFYSSNATALLASDNGSVYRCMFPQGSKFIQRIYTAGASSEDNFWRLAQSDEDDACLLLSSSTLRWLDFRSQESSTKIFATQHTGEVFTSVEGASEDQLIRICSTSQVLWVDKRYTAKPVIAIHHGRRFDRTLRTYTMAFAETFLTLLHCSSNGLLTIYDVSRSQSGPAQLHVPPYCLPFVSTYSHPLVGHAFIRHPADSSALNASLFQLSREGSLHKIDLSFSLDGATSSVRPLGGRGFKRSDEMQKLEQRSRALRFGHGPMDACRSEVHDFRELYNEVFRDRKSTGDESAVYDVLDDMVSTWQSLEPPVEHPLTTYEIALLSDPESHDGSRAGSMSSTLLNSVRGYRALVQGRIPREKLKRRAPWHLDISPTLEYFVPDMHHEPCEIVRSLEQLDLLSERNRPATSLRTESEAREQLALDMVLSADVFSQRPVQKTSVNVSEDPLEVMSRATEAMSLNDMEPPVVQFGFLQPVGTRCGEVDTTLEDRAGVRSIKEQKGDEEGLKTTTDGSLGIRLLLSDWTVGGNPQEYSYEDPYGVANVSTRKPPFLAGYPTTVGVAALDQRPPTVVPIVPPVLTSALRPSIAARGRPSSQPQMPPPMFGSQPAGMVWEPTGMSQDMLPSTQVLPGPHGGRPPLAKKLTKKRVGGF